MPAAAANICRFYIISDVDINMAIYSLILKPEAAVELSKDVVWSIFSRIFMSNEFSLLAGAHSISGGQTIDREAEYHCHII